MRRLGVLAAAVGLSAMPVLAQEEGLAAPCNDPRVPSPERGNCIIVAQAVESAQPQLGILLAGGNPTLGTASTGGIRLGVLPRVSATAKANLVFIRLPDILAESSGSAVQRLNDVAGIPAPALSGTVSVGVYPGVSLAPTVGGFGAVDLLGSATWLPLSTFDVEGFSDGSVPEFAYGLGARVGILRESFTMPGISVSLMYRSLGRLAYGNVCEQTGLGGVTEERNGYVVQAGLCQGGGDPGEFEVDLTDWSARGAVSKRLLGVGVTAGVGYDRFGSDVGFGLRTACPVAESPGCFARFRGMELDNDRWSGFVDGSFSLLLATVAVEVGWLQGEEPLPSFRNLASEFDPKDGTFFGSIGLRLAL
ncbi:MAG TPA: hypothetical protein VHG28_08940 [Longimicrobiaceae bacterium]|nr:hypothetical protein [Longimicrobiaceae bacterium]